MVAVVEDPHERGSKLLVGPFPDDDGVIAWALSEAMAGGPIEATSVALLSPALYRHYASRGAVPDPGTQGHAQLDGGTA